MLTFAISGSTDTGNGLLCSIKEYLFFIDIVKDFIVNFTNVLFNWFTCFHIFLVILKITLVVSLIRNIVQSTEEKILPHIFFRFHYFFYIPVRPFWVFKVLFCLIYFVWSLMKAFFSASPVSKPKYFPTASQAFSSSIHCGMLGSLYHTSMDTFVLQLPVVLLMLLTFFNLVFKKAFLQWGLFELECKEINYFLFSEKLWYHAFIVECFCSFKLIEYPKVYNKISNIF